MANQCNLINGIFILDKAHGVSSNHALQKVKRLFNAKKAGHTGSLDVLATGLLPIVLGEATKFSQFLLDADKAYQVTACLGKRTTTLDAEGDVLEEKSFAHVRQDQIRKILKNFTGDIQQIPPMYSALKRGGKTLYKLARQGVEVEREARPVTIYNIELIEWQQEKLTLNVHCSKGTYIRTLIDDIGQALNCGAYVSDLRRTTAGLFQASQMHTIDALEEMSAQQRLNTLLPIDAMLVIYRKLDLNAEQVEKLYCGLTVCHAGPTPSLTKHGVEKNFYRLYHNHQFIGLAELIDNVLKVKRLLAR